MQSLLVLGLSSGFFVLAASAQQNAQSAVNSDLNQRMKALHDINSSLDASGSQTRTPLLGGPDDDPTLAADLMDHEASPMARKLAVKGEHLSRKGKHDEAVEEFKQAVATDPLYYEAQNNLALEYFAAGKPDLAIATLRQLTQTDKKHVLAFDNLAILLCRLHRYAEAETVAAQAYRMHPFSYKANYVYGSALVNQGKWTADARQSLRYASERHPEAKELLARWPAAGNGHPQ